MAAVQGHFQRLDENTAIEWDGCYYLCTPEEYEKLSTCDIQPLKLVVGADNHGPWIDWVNVDGTITQKQWLECD